VLLSSHTTLGELIVVSICLIGVAVVVDGCADPSHPEDVVMWIASEGDRAEALEALTERFNAAQESIIVRPRRWDAAVVSPPSGEKIRSALMSVDDPALVPALVEVPEEGLVAMVDGELARVVSGGFAERLGVRFDDFEPWLMPSSRVRSKGVVGLPLFHDVPVLLFPQGSPLAAQVRRDGLVAFASAPAHADSSGQESEGHEEQGGNEASIVGETIEADEVSAPPAPVLPLAAAADYRVVIALLRATKALAVHGDEGGFVLDAERFAAAERLYEKIFPRGMLERGGRGEAEAIEMLLRGEASAALVWSSRLGTIRRRDLEAVRAPIRTRGTFLVVNAHAQWRDRQDAFRVAQWLTEPMQSADLASRFWTAPTRASATKSARYRHASGVRSFRDAVTEPDHPLLLPDNTAFIDVFATRVEPALTKANLEDGLFRALQLTLNEADNMDR